MEVRVRDLLEDSELEDIRRRQIRKDTSFAGRVSRAIIILGSNCPHCEKLVDSSMFKELMKAAVDRLWIAFDDEAYLYGADFANIANLIERRAGYETPSVVLNDDAFRLEEKGISLMKLAKELGIPLIVKKRSKKTEAAEVESSRKKSKRARSKNEFVERKQLKKEVRKALEGCSGEVCTEI